MTNGCSGRKCTLHYSFCGYIFDIEILPKDLKEIATERINEYIATVEERDAKERKENKAEDAKKEPPKDLKAKDSNKKDGEKKEMKEPPKMVKTQELVALNGKKVTVKGILNKKNSALLVFEIKK